MYIVVSLYFRTNRKRNLHKLSFVCMLNRCLVPSHVVRIPNSIYARLSQNHFLRIKLQLMLSIESPVARISICNIKVQECIVGAAFSDSKFTCAHMSEMHMHVTARRANRFFHFYFCWIIWMPSHCCTLYWGMFFMTPFLLSLKGNANRRNNLFIKSISFLVKDLA